MQLKPCPFCGFDKPKVRHIGNNHTKKRSLEISCPKCRIKRTNAALRYGFDWLEEISEKQWNQRP